MEVLELLAQAGADLNAKNKHDETPADICEDPELKERILQLKIEQESKQKEDTRRKRIRRSHSNTRAQSVRRTSLRDKGLTTRRDAVEEARLRLQAENKTTKVMINFSKTLSSIFNEHEAIKSVVHMPLNWCSRQSIFNVLLIKVGFFE